MAPQSKPPVRLSLGLVLITSGLIVLAIAFGPWMLARMRALDHIYPDGIHIPDYFIGKNIVHLPTVKCHIYTTTTGAMKNAFGGLLAKAKLGSAHAVDAFVVSTALEFDSAVIATGDPKDMKRLLGVNRKVRVFAL